MTAISSWRQAAGKIYIKTPYCEAVVNQCRKWGGKFSDGEWALPDTRLSEVKELLGADQDDLVEVEVDNEDYEGYAQISVGWHVLAGRRGRDYSADIYADLVEGEIPASGGSVKNPRVAASSDARFRLWVPRDFAEARGLLRLATDMKIEPAKPANPLADLSDEEIDSRLASLIAERERRGVLQS